jgi:hypothetical protein
MKELFRVQRPGATPQELADLQVALGYDLPRVYLSFLTETNGAEWGIHDGNSGDCLALWQVNEIVTLNQAYQIQRWLPHVLAIGSDGGGDAIVLNKSSLSHPDSWPVARVGFGALDVDEMTLQASSFAHWASSEFRLIKGD